VLTDGACQAVQRLRAAGVELALTSGRPPRGMGMLVAPLNLTTPIAAFNGGVFATPDLTTVIERRTLPLAAAGETLDFLLQAGLDVWVYRDADWFVRSRQAPHVAREQATVQFEPTVESDLTAALDFACRAASWTCTRAGAESPSRQELLNSGQRDDASWGDAPDAL